MVRQLYPGTASYSQKQSLILAFSMQARAVPVYGAGHGKHVEMAI